MSQAINRLRAAGYEYDFRAEGEHLECDQCAAEVEPSTVQVDHVVRFEGVSDPGDSAVLYALDAGDGHRGLYASAYGADVTLADIAVIRALPNQ